MPRNRSFWRHAVVIGALHLVLLIALVKSSGHKQKPLATTVLWMNQNAIAPSNVPSLAAATLPELPDPTPAPPVKEEDPPREQTPPPPAESATAVPRPTPVPSVASTPSPTIKPRPEKKPAKANKPTVKPTPAKKEKPKKTTHPSAKSSVKTVTTSKPSPAGGSKSGGRGGSGVAKEFEWYGNMLHDRFFSAWVQPKSVLVTGATMSALVRLRIEPDGRVSEFALVRPSGNVVVDESVASVAKRVPRVDPLPKGLADGAYEVQINFELNPQ
ncbi:MAG: TonB family protein [Chthoniobacterales bacterium]